ncbi:MAG: MnhB domain-containing protein [Thermoleophilia bacterium]|nr:MnhB domain-containing protein [Thermoleophilia bacterium]
MTGVLTEAVARLLLAPSLILAAAILVKGYSDVGDGFTAGVVAGLAVLLQYAAFGYRRVERVLPVRAAVGVALAGLALALAVAFVPLLWGAEAVTHYPRPAEHVVHVGTVELLTAVAFDVGVFLLVLGMSVGAVDAFARAAGERREP